MAFCGCPIGGARAATPAPRLDWRDVASDGEAALGGRLAPTPSPIPVPWRLLASDGRAALAGKLVGARPPRLALAAAADDRDPALGGRRQLARAPGPSLPRRKHRRPAAIALALPEDDSVATAGYRLGLQTALLEVSVNGAPHPDAAYILRDRWGGLYARPEDIKAWRMRLPGRQIVYFDGERFQALPAERAAYDLDMRGQRLQIVVDPTFLAPTSFAARTAERHEITPSGTGGFFNYELLGQYSEHDATLNGLFEAGLFTKAGLLTTNVVERWSAGSPEFTRLETSWTTDWPDKMLSLRLGDSITRSGIGGAPLRFGGIQFGRRFETQPEFITLPLATVEGSAAVPSVVDVYIDNSLRARRDIPAGPFDVTELPLTTGSGEVRLVVRDALGRETVTTQSYYSAPSLLRSGLHDFSYELGFLRRDFGERSNSYGDPVASATHRYGVTDWFTGEIHAEATPDAQVLGLGTDFTLGAVGAVRAWGSGSRSDLGVGGRAGGSVEHQGGTFSIGAQAEVTTADYRFPALPPDRLPPAADLRGFIGFSMGPVGRMSLSYIARDNRDRPDTKLAGLTWSARLGEFGSLYLAAQHSLTDSETSAGLTLSIPLGGRASASSGVRYDAGRYTGTAMVQSSPPVGEGFGYRASASGGEGRERYDGSVRYQGPAGAYDLAVAHSAGGTAARLGVSGGFGFVGGSLFASRELKQSFAKVDVGDFEGVGIYADNHLVARTDASGTAIVPRLRPFQANVIRIDQSDLPLDADLRGIALTVRPRDRTGLSLTFDTAPARGATLVVQLADGSAPPAGATATVEATGESFIVAPGGETYLAGLSQRNRVRVSWQGGTCGFDLDFPSHSEPQPDLGTFICRPLT